MDYKEWIQNKADELSLSLYDADYYDLDTDTQHFIWTQAEEAYQDYMASKRDALHDRMKEEQMFGRRTK